MRQPEPLARPDWLPYSNWTARAIIFRYLNPVVVRSFSIAGITTKLITDSLNGYAKRRRNLGLVLSASPDWTVAA